MDLSPAQVNHGAQRAAFGGVIAAADISLIERCGSLWPSWLSLSGATLVLTRA